MCPHAPLSHGPLRRAFDPRSSHSDEILRPNRVPSPPSGICKRRQTNKANVFINIPDHIFRPSPHHQPPPLLTSLGTPPNERSRLALESRRTACTGHMCGTADTSSTAARPSQSDCRPTARDSVMVDWYPVNERKNERWINSCALQSGPPSPLPHSPEYPDGCTGKSQTRWDA